MPLYITRFVYTSEGLGGRVISFHCTFGEYGGVIIYKAPTTPPPRP